MESFEWNASVSATAAAVTVGDVAADAERDDDGEPRLKTRNKMAGVNLCDRTEQMI